MTVFPRFRNFSTPESYNYVENDRKSVAGLKKGRSCRLDWMDRVWMFDRLCARACRRRRRRIYERCT